MSVHSCARSLGVILIFQTCLGVGGASAASPSAPSVSPATLADSAQTDFALLVEPLSAEWEARLVPPMLQNLLRIAPYTTLRAEPAAAVRAVAGSSRRLALMRRSSALAAGAGENQGLELLEIGPASCLTLVTGKDRRWRNYADLNYGLNRPLRVEAVSPGALADFQRLLVDFPIGGKVVAQTRPTHIALQRLLAGEADLVALDIPRRGASNQPDDVMSFVTTRELHLLELPQTLESQEQGRRIGEIVVASGWFWESPQVYRSLCDPFVLVLPATGADHLVYSLYTGIGKAETNQNTPSDKGLHENGLHENAKTRSEPDFFASFNEAFRRLLVTLGILSQ